MLTATYTLKTTKKLSCIIQHEQLNYDEPKINELISHIDLLQ